MVERRRHRLAADLGECSSPQPFTPRPPRSTRISRPRHEPERSIVPAFVLGGAIAGLVPLLAGVIGVLTTARYGLNPGLSGIGT